MEIIEHHRRQRPLDHGHPPAPWERWLLHPALSGGLAVLALLLAARAQPLDALHLGQLLVSLGLCGVLRVAAHQRSRLAAAARHHGSEAQARTLWLDAVSGLSPNGVLVFERDATQGHRLVFTNPAFSQLFGLRPEELLGLSEPAADEWLAGLAPTDGAMPPLAPGDATLSLAGPPARVLRRSCREDARQRVYYFRDVTHETAVERLKNDFLTTAAHELRTPLAAVYGFSELLLNPVLAEPRRQEVCAVVHRQAGVLKHLVDELLTLARIDAHGAAEFTLGPCELRALARTTLATLEPAQAARLALQEGSTESWAIADPGKLGQALHHLVSNALKYSGPADPVQLALGADERDGERWVTLTVRDSGPGMDAETCERAFERFYRADPSGHRLGAGLGLSIVAEIMRWMGGAVTLHSAPGAGTTVVLWLRPAAERHEPPAITS